LNSRQPNVNSSVTARRIADEEHQQEQKGGR
jgi:hypothetical protein